MILRGLTEQMGCTKCGEKFRPNAAQIWIASTGAVDESSISTVRFDGQLAFVHSSLATGTVTLRYNVLPAGDLLKPITDRSTEGRGLVVRFLDNGS